MEQVTVREGASPPLPALPRPTPGRRIADAFRFAGLLLSQLGLPGSAAALGRRLDSLPEGLMSSLSADAPSEDSARPLPRPLPEAGRGALDAKGGWKSDSSHVGYCGLTAAYFVHSAREGNPSQAL